MYELPQFDLTSFKKKVSKFFENRVLSLLLLAAIILIAVGFYTGVFSVSYFQKPADSIFEKIEKSLVQLPDDQQQAEKYSSEISYEQAIIKAVKEASPSVVSIIISKNLPVYEQQFISPFENFPGYPFELQVPQYVQKGTQKQQVGAGSGFIVSEDGLVLTNKHVVLDKEAEYTVLTNDGKKYSAKVLALDPVQDLAIVRISRSLGDRGSSTPIKSRVLDEIGTESGQDNQKFTTIKLGDSSSIQIGQTAIAIGNALGEFRNTVSIGVISGLGRTVSASGGGFSEILEDVIQTDAAINQGNSGGPLLNLKGEVVGVNTAMAQGAQTIGFAIPINIAKRDINQVIKTNKIIYPFLGVRYVLVDDTVQQKYNLSVDYGALILPGSSGEAAITPGSAAEISGLKEKDIVLEFNGKKITKDHSLAKAISKYNPGDKITLRVLRDGQEFNIEVVLGERKD